MNPELPIHTYPINIGVNERAFAGLAHQNMTCIQALCELVDNAIAAYPEQQQGLVAIILSECPTDANAVTFTVADWGVGMGLTELSEALQLGSAPSTDDPLHEHGYGLKNALSMLSAGSDRWSLSTRRAADGPYYQVSGPLRPQMIACEEEAPCLPPGVTLPRENPATVIAVTVPLSYARTLTYRGSRTVSLASFREWLLEHLGITYRGFLEQDLTTMDANVKILLRIGASDVYVPPIEIPVHKAEERHFDIDLGGQMVPLTYRYGVLDRDLCQGRLAGDNVRFDIRAHYQGNRPTQGIDIRLGRRVIAQSQFSEIWQNPEGDPLERHNSYNLFCGELRIPALPRGVLPTLNNKTGPDISRDEWQRIFEKLRQFPPPKSPVAESERKLCEQWMRKLREVCPQDTVSAEVSVWDAGTRIDVVDTDGRGKYHIFELKCGKAEPQHLAQLRMYWDGLVLTGVQPTQATLIVRAYSKSLLLMLEKFNALPTPPLPDGTPSQPYCFEIALLEEKGLA